MARGKEKLSEQFVIRLTPSEARAFDDMKEEGGYRSRGEMARLLIRSILHDDAAAHGKTLQPTGA